MESRTECKRNSTSRLPPPSLPTCLKITNAADAIRILPPHSHHSHRTHNCVFPLSKRSHTFTVLCCINGAPNRFSWMMQGVFGGYAAWIVVNALVLGANVKSAQVDLTSAFATNLQLSKSSVLSMLVPLVLSVAGISGFIATLWFDLLLHFPHPPLLPFFCTKHLIVKQGCALIQEHVHSK